MDYWRQQQDKPLYPDLLWSKPVAKRGAGKLLIIGGNSYGFSLVAQAYSGSERAGAGHIRALVPDSLTKITRGLPFIEYAPSNHSGGFAKSALRTLLELAEWSDGVLIAGDLGKNSETSLLLESFLNKCQAVSIISTEALGSLNMPAGDLLGSSKRVVIWTRSDLQKAVTSLKLPKSVTSETGKAQIADILYDISTNHPANLVINDNNIVWVAHNAKVVSTDSTQSFAASRFAVWAIQNPEKKEEALTCAAWELKSSNS